MSDEQRLLLEQLRKKVTSAIDLVEASVARTGEYDSTQNMSPEELEPFDALSDRFVRAVETAIRYFRARERFEESVSPDTLRDLLPHMQKLRLVNSVETWMDMRDVRNRIAHDYTPEQAARLYRDIRGPFFEELERLRDRLQ